MDETEGIRVVHAEYGFGGRKVGKRTEILPFTRLRDVDGPFLRRGILYAVSSQIALYRYLDHLDEWVPASMNLSGVRTDRVTGERSLVMEKFRTTIDQLTEQQAQAFIELKLRTN